MTKKRIGNDLHFTWRIWRKDGETLVPETWEGKAVEVLLLDPMRRRVELTGVELAEGVARFTFLGKDQRTLGDYLAVLTENSGTEGMVTVDVVQAVTLVPHSYMEQVTDCSSETAGGVIEAEAVTLESTLTAGGGGSDRSEEIERLRKELLALIGEKAPLTSDNEELLLQWGKAEGKKMFLSPTALAFADHEKPGETANVAPGFVGATKMSTQQLLLGNAFLELPQKRLRQTWYDGKDERHDDTYVTEGDMQEALPEKVSELENDAGYVTRQQVANKQDKERLVEAKGTVLMAETGVYYRMTNVVNSLSLILPAVSGTEYADRVTVCMTTGENVGVLMGTADGAPIYFDKEFLLVKNQTYDLVATWNGERWLVKCKHYTDGTDEGGDEPIPDGDYLYFKVIDYGTQFLYTKYGEGDDLWYSPNDGATWKQLAPNTWTEEFIPGDVVLWRGYITPSSSTVRGEGGTVNFAANGDFEAGGDPRTLTAGEEYADAPLQSSHFMGLFWQNTHLTNAARVHLTVDELAPYCYTSMFHSCTSLTQAPALPAMTLAPYCYASMFYSCTSLTQAPALPAMTLAQYCYQYMFHSCTSLTQAPALPAMTLAQYCYQHMFHSCTSLTQAPALPAMTLAQYCYQSMFHSCTSLTQAPALPAMTLAPYCYQYMFHSCSKLTSVECLALNNAAGATYGWLEGCPNTTACQFTKRKGVTWWTRNTSGIPSNWQVTEK